jgi:hypothetical protein
MRGVQFLVDENGEKTRIVIDRKRNPRLWEDVCDVLLTRQRAAEPRESLASVKRQLRRAGDGDSYVGGR